MWRNPADQEAIVGFFSIFMLFHCMFRNLPLIQTYFMEDGLFNIGSDLVFGSRLTFAVPFLLLLSLASSSSI